jgi:hypothetical protein
MKLQRPGYTETTLMFCDYLKKIGIEDEKIDIKENNFIFWLYKSSGWYDMSLPCSGLKNLPFHDLPYEGGCNLCAEDLANLIKKSYCYGYWKEHYYESIKDSDFIIPLLHKVSGYNNFKEQFFDSLNHKNKINTQFNNYWTNQEKLYSLIENKKVLVVSCFAELISQQYECGNVFKIYNNFPKIKKLFTYCFPYTFFNKGPLENSIDTLNQAFDDVKKIDFDVAIISAGSYGCLLADLVHKTGRVGISIGRNASDMFGVNPKKKNLEFWINKIPKKYIPDGYEYIENGVYWIGEKD